MHVLTFPGRPQEPNSQRPITKEDFVQISPADQYQLEIQHVDRATQLMLRPLI